MSSVFALSRKAISDLSHLAANIGRRCWVYISKEPRSDEWMAFAVAEAKEEWQRRNARERRNSR
jgi:hypothetical protein